MKVIELQVKNLMRLGAVELQPDGNMVVVGGNNGQGKSSLLNSIAFALGGKALVPKEPVKQGEKRAKIVVDLGDLKITRTFTAKGGRDSGTLTVTDGNGEKVGSPQALLDRIANRFTYDPLEFIRAPVKEQNELLLGMVGVDFADLDAEARDIAEEQKDLNRFIRTTGATVDAMAAKVPEETPDEPVSMSGIQDEFDKARAHNKANQEARDNLEDAKKNYVEIRRQRDATAEQIATLQGRLDDLDKQLGEAKAQGQGLEEVVSSVEDVDTAAIEAKFQRLAEINEGVRLKGEVAAKAAEVDKKRGRLKELKARAKEIPAAKAAKMTEADIPVEGLGFDEGITFDEVPLEQCSQAEQLRVAVALGVAARPELRVFLVRDGSLLDPESLALLGELAEENDVQVWVERVGHGEECEIIIHDGQVVEGGAE